MASTSTRPKPVANPFPSSCTSRRWLANAWLFWGLKLAGWCCLLLAGPVAAQSLAGTWQGVEDPTAARYYPAVLRVQRGMGDRLFGILYQEVGPQPRMNVTFEMEGVRSGTGMKLNHLRKLNETGGSISSYWCDGSITFTYDASQEKLTGHAQYDPYGECDTGEFTFYRVKLKSPPSVPKGVASTLRVSGKDVRWYADAGHQQLLGTGNTYRATLSKNTTFYLTQGFFPSAESGPVPITVKVKASGAAPKKLATPPRPVAPIVAPLPTRPDTVLVAPAPPPTPTLPTGPAPLVLPTVLFKLGTAELLPSAHAALDNLAAELQAQPTVRLRITGHTDRLGESDKNQTLSEQRATAVKTYLVKAGVAASRLETAGYGDTRLLYSSPDIRNRRVEVERL